MSIVLVFFQSSMLKIFRIHGQAVGTQYTTATAPQGSHTAPGVGTFAETKKEKKLTLKQKIERSLEVKDYELAFNIVCPNNY